MSAICSRFTLSLMMSCSTSRARSCLRAVCLGFESLNGPFELRDLTVDDSILARSSNLRQLFLSPGVLGAIRFLVDPNLGWIDGSLGLR